MFTQSAKTGHAPNRSQQHKIAGTIAALLAGSALQDETVDTRIGKPEFTHSYADGYPTDATGEKLYNELGFPRAVQAYLWSIPLVSMAQWQYAHVHAGLGQTFEVLIERKH